MPSLEDLPREIMTLICSRLEQSEKYVCIQVNRELHSACISELWREPFIESLESLQQLIKSLYHAKHQRGEYIRALRLGYDIGVSDEDLTSLLPLIPNLEVFVAKQARLLTDQSLIPLSNACRQLKQFSITGSPATYRTAHYLGRCLALQKVRLASCPNLSPMALLPLAHRPLEELDLAGCKWLTVQDTGLDMGTLVGLTHLNLLCCDMISAEFLEQLAGLVHLQDFSMTGNTVIDDRAMIPFIKSHRQLKDLFLLECAITDLTLSVISQYLPDLHHLDVSFCTQVTGTGLRSLIHHCLYLRLLGVKYCDVVLDDFPELALTELETLTCDEIDCVRKHPMESLQETYLYINQYLSTEQAH
ncbi:hypothetical protein BY458DRAFT_527376 [Sporodiniella umbellata]|nr:hypothetical protein BY458DRAFT_527376 [Sporodiniella umbellata]